MKILHVTPAYEPAWKTGGVVRAISLLCRGLVSLGHKVTVFTTNTDGTGYLDVPINQPVDVGGVEVYYFHTPMPKFLRYSKKLAKACRENMSDFDIVHIASFWNYPGMPAVRECKKRGIPYVISAHGTFVPISLNSKKLKKWVYLKLFDEKQLKNASAFHYTTALERRKMRSFKIRKPNFIVPNGLYMKEFETFPDREEAKRFWGFCGDDVIITFLGRLNWVKALDVLIRSFKKVLDNLPKVRLILAGPDGGQKIDLERLAVELGLKDRVFFVGPVNSEKRLKLFAASDVFTLVSWTENFGNAAVEAMACGVPVLVSENVGICDAVREDGAGLVVPVDEEAIAKALIEMLSNPDKLNEMSRAAYKSARKRYDIKMVAELMVKAYEDILTGRRSPECNWSDSNLNS